MNCFLVIFVLCYVCTNGIHGQSLNLDTLKDDDDTVGAMTTLEPIDLVEEINCAKYESCDECVSHNCSWIQCPSAFGAVCNVEPDDLCPIAQCSDNKTTTEQPTTITDVPTTITDVPTTITDVPTTITDVPTTITDVPTTITDVPTTITDGPTTVKPTPAPTPEPDTTHVPTPPVTDTSTSSTSTTTTTAAPAHRGHFDAASFVGGIILCLSLTAIGYAGLKFYRRRMLAPTYSNF